MVGLVKLAGTAVFALGVIFLIKPDQIKKWLHFWMDESHLYMGGLLNVLLGIVFLLAAFKCRIPWLVILFGAISLLKGILLFIFGRQKILPILEKYNRQRPKALRRLAILALVFGYLTIYAA